MPIRPPGAWMRAEILEEPHAVARVLDREMRAAAAVAAKARRGGARLAVLAARGSSDHAAIVGKYLFEWAAGLPSALAATSLASLYRRDLALRGALVVGISQSGRSPDVVEYLRRARRSGALTVAVTNDPGSPLARQAHDVLACHAGPERSVCATKTYAAQLAALYLLAAALAPQERGRALRRRLERAPEDLSGIMMREPEIAAAARRLEDVRRCVVLGRGFSYPAALETALKLKEAAGVFAEGLSAADFLHGHVGMLARPPRNDLAAVLLETPGPGAASLAEARKRLSRFGVATTVLADTGPDWLSPLTLSAAGHLLAFRLALGVGLDPDAPAGLSKVTRTR